MWYCCSQRVYVVLIIKQPHTILPDINKPQPGELLKLLRNLRGIKQNDAAKKLGVGQQAISKLEHCKKISAKKFDKIIMAFQFSQEEIEAAKKYLPPQ